MYAKFISESQIEIAPQNKGAWSNYDQNEALLLADGYLPVNVIESPTTEKPIIKYRLADNKIEQYAESAPVIPVPEQMPEEKAAITRATRGRLLADCDWTQLADAPLIVEQKTAWAVYRQALRDVPEQSGFPINIVWPEEPV